MSKTIKITDTNGVCYIRVADIGAVIVEYPRTIHVTSHRGDPMVTLNCADTEAADRDAADIAAAIEKEA